MLFFVCVIESASTYPAIKAANLDPSNPSVIELFTRLAKSSVVDDAHSTRVNVRQRHA
jgi:hypothetical protein